MKIKNNEIKSPELNEAELEQASGGALGILVQPPLYGICPKCSKQYPLGQPDSSDCPDCHVPLVIG